VQLLLVATIELVTFLERNKVLEKITPRPRVSLSDFCKIVKEWTSGRWYTDKWWFSFI